ncbi:Abi family protein [Kribbella sp. CA-293567]|uniref:Abi family protein n=1 Tax=Kribbella sp. CA-293567 TaxID=3002436 RepID=UPI0022DD2D5F|nr:Abi family protein [Kribbella sp. CA-293567]WBQ05654.1 Abi family protein [Kribbella sp. CA-293567]
MDLYTKPHLTFADQVKLLESRGLLIRDPGAAADLLSVVGYYRLSGYWYPYRRSIQGQDGRDDQFVAGTTFDQVVHLYDTDRRLKLMVLAAIERVEVALRVKIGFTLGRRGAYAHLNGAALDGQFVRARPGRLSIHQEWLQKILTAQTRSSEDFVVHFRRKYDGKLPVWVLTEIMDFGSMSYLYGGLKSVDRDEIARSLRVVAANGAGNGPALVNWLRVLNYVRNVCAHHSRLWNRNLVSQIAPRHLRAISPLAHLGDPSGDSHFRIYSTLCILAFLLRRFGDESQWAASVRNLLQTDIPRCGRQLHELGIPAGWIDSPQWSS